ncbi:MAG: YicC family protein [Bacteriovorax sp. MedPE-SWde]|nr:MAG: YicC family protein [Bacteriovorax sp. MedPE-SWde]
MTQVYSMTGFGKHEVESESIQLTVEIKSVNHRFKDIRFKMSSLFTPIELELRNLINANFKRGSFDVFINFRRVDSSTRFDDIDEGKVSAFIQKVKNIATAQGLDIGVRPTEFLRSEFLKDNDNTFGEELAELAREAFPKALEALKSSRSGEGEKLVTVLQDHRKKYEEHFGVVLDHADTFQEKVKERLQKRFEEYQTSMPVDEPRFVQEIIFYLEKMDVHEEINRIKVHLSKLDDLLSAGGEVGRQIDFLIQELNRETNTTGSKSTVQEISETVVQMKVQLEKIREQALNLE